MIATHHNKREAPIFPFDVILFDIGGVLLTNGWDNRERALVLDQFGLDRVDFEARHREAYGEWERGLVPVETYLDQTVFHEPRSFTRQEFFAAMRSQSKLLPHGALGILQEIAASHRYTVGALNNEARESNEFRFDHFGLRPLFQVALSSCYLHLRKPDPEIYLLSLDILGKPAKRILFIDDRAMNTAAAEAAGMKAVRFEDADGLRRDLVALGVLY